MSRPSYTWPILMFPNKALSIWKGHLKIKVWLFPSPPKCYCYYYYYLKRRNTAHVEAWAPICPTCRQQWGSGVSGGEVRQWMVTEASSLLSLRKRKPLRTARFLQILETQVYSQRSSMTTPIHKRLKKKWHVLKVIMSHSRTSEC